MKKGKKTWSLFNRNFLFFSIIAVFSFLINVALLFIYLQYMDNIRPEILAIVAFAFALLFGVIFFYFKYVVQPYIKTTKQIKLFNADYLSDSLSKIEVHLSDEFEKTIKKMRLTQVRPLEIFEFKKQAEYIALQNQINPHFLYNTLEAIRGEALTQGMTGIADMTEALATFFRYTISKNENLVTLEDELNNAKNYFLIQQYRFGERLNFLIRYDEQDGVLDFRLPKLTLQPIIENAIYHGIECKVGVANIDVNIETTKSRLIINVIDDGRGIDENTLNALNKTLNTSDTYEVKSATQSKGGIALVNVNNRIKLLFGENYGIRISSTINIGTDVEITLPLITENVSGHWFD